MSNFYKQNKQNKFTHVKKNKMIRIFKVKMMMSYNKFRAYYYVRR